MFVFNRIQRRLSIVPGYWCSDYSSDMHYAVTVETKAMYSILNIIVQLTFKLSTMVTHPLHRQPLAQQAPYRSCVTMALLSQGPQAL